MSLIVHDEYIQNVSTYVSEQCESLDSIISRYIRYMNKVLDEGIMAGKTAESLRQFLVELSNSLGTGDTPAEMKPYVERFCSCFKERVDDADEKLY